MRDPAVVAYNIYSKTIDEPYFTQIGTTKAKSYSTSDRWARNPSIKTRVYAVTAVRRDGKESFLSNMVLNNDRDHDGLTDAEELELGTNPGKADTDGDGLNDGEEYKDHASAAALRASIRSW